MSAFNILIVEIQCLNCGKHPTAPVQFKFGNTAFLRYHIGDTIVWGGNDIGSGDFEKVKAYGIVEVYACPLCNSSNIIEEYDIFIEGNVIIRIAPMEDIECYLEEGKSEYVVLD